MNQNVAEIALMFILPLGVTFITILQAASAEYRYQKVTGALFAFIVVVMDCLFYFTRNSFISYNTDGGLLLAFASLFFFGLLYVVRSNDRAEKCANIMFSAFMLAAFIGIAYWERPTLLVASEFSPEEIAAQNAKYQDYIESFQNGGSGGTWKTAPRAAQASGGTVVNTPGEKVVLSSAAKSRLDRYIGETDKVIARMYEIMVAIDSYEPIAPSITDASTKKRRHSTRRPWGFSIRMNRAKRIPITSRRPKACVWRLTRCTPTPCRKIPRSR